MNADSDPLPKPITQALRASMIALGEELPLNPEEVAAFDASGAIESQPPADEATVDRFMARWHASRAEAAARPAIPPTPTEPLALAARSGTAISDETKTTISDLVRDMEKENPHAPKK